MVTYMGCNFAAGEYHNLQYSQDIDNLNMGLILDPPVKSGLPLETEIIFNEINHFSDHNNIFLIGPSTVRNGIVIKESSIPKIWDIHNLAIGGGSPISENILHVNFLNAYANHKPDKSDVIVLHISNIAFYNPPPSQRYVSQLIKAYNVYTIDEDLQVHGYMPNIYLESMFSKERIFKPIGDILGINKFSVGQSIYLKLEDVSKSIFFKSNTQSDINETFTYHSPSEVAGYKERWRILSQNNTYPSSETNNFKNFLKKINGQTNIVLVDMYLPSWQKDLETQKEYQNWTQSDLIPFLKENQIAYVDISNSFADDEFVDSGHLNKAGREHFTKLFDEYLNPILFNISAS